MTCNCRRNSLCAQTISFTKKNGKPRYPMRIMQQTQRMQAFFSEKGHRYTGEIPCRGHFLSKYVPTDAVLHHGLWDRYITKSSEYTVSALLTLEHIYWQLHYPNPGYSFKRVIWIQVPSSLCERKSFKGQYENNSTNLLMYVTLVSKIEYKIKIIWT